MGLIFAAMLSAVAGSPPASVPFHVGETLEYSGSYHLLFPISIGHAATLSVAAIDTVRGRPCWKFSFVTDVSVPLFHNHSELTSWTTTDGFVSLRFVHLVDESHYSRHDDYRIYPDSGMWRNRRDNSTHDTPSAPLDDIAFIYYLRLPTTPLQLGRNYRLDRYYRADRNPVIINVVGREACDLPDDARSTCRVLNPVVDDPPHGMFMARENARLWITDDGRRLPVRIKSGHVTLTLSKISG
ncbi:MAG: DUF3108 domain-containing protein [Gemmatimonadales bacterium]